MNCGESFLEACHQKNFPLVLLGEIGCLPTTEQLLAKRKEIPVYVLVSSRCVHKTFVWVPGFHGPGRSGNAADRTVAYYIASMYLSLLSLTDIKVFSNFYFINMAAELTLEHTHSEKSFSRITVYSCLGRGWVLLWHFPNILKSRKYNKVPMSIP